MNLRSSWAIAEKAGASFSISSEMPCVFWASGGIGMPGCTRLWKRPVSFPPTIRIAPTSQTRSPSGLRPVVSTSITTNAVVRGSSIGGF
jgi:hypothetical protein